MTGFGILAEQVKEKVLKIRKEEDYIIGLRKALQRRSFSSKQIKRIAAETGFNKDKIEKIFDYWQE
jgi:SOS response regulatory protein OraA/RecX